jgi:hypothetical protein
MRFLVSGKEPARGRHAPYLWFVEPVSALYIGVIALVAQATGLFYVLFPALGALGHDMLMRRRGTWARATVLLVVTPLLTAIGGTLITRHLSYEILAVFLSVGYSVLVIGVLSSPIAPAISAGLLPLCLNLRSWWYAPSLLIGTGLLAGIAALRSKAEGRAVRIAGPRDLADDIVEEAPANYSWVPFFLAFLLLTVVASEITGWRLVLFPPLVVMAFEAFAHPSVCPWGGAHADRRLRYYRTRRGTLHDLPRHGAGWSDVQRAGRYRSATHSRPTRSARFGGGSPALRDSSSGPLVSPRCDPQDSASGKRAPGMALDR